MRRNKKYIDIENIHASFHNSSRHVFLIWDERPLYLTFSDYDLYEEFARKLRPYCYQFGFAEKYDIEEYFSSRKHSKVMKVSEKATKQIFAAKMFSKTMWLQQAGEIMVILFILLYTRC
jgi:hypothetical protein